jgi:hypothetical protein
MRVNLLGGLIFTDSMGFGKEHDDEREENGGYKRTQTP